MAAEIDPKLAVKLIVPPQEPVPGFPIKFSWHENYWPKLFDEQVALIRRDIRRARADGKLIIYLSCPISPRGGGDQSTNVEIAKGVERRLLSQWGERFWILNPAQYQLESKEGTGLMEEHAQKLGINLKELRQYSQPGGGDYMRMWAQAFDEFKLLDPNLRNTGQHFDAYYFLGPKDVAEFFSKAGTTSMTAGIEAYFAHKFATDPDFRDTYSMKELEWYKGWQTDQSTTGDVKKRQHQLRTQWADMRRQFVRFYALRASANFSLGSHDEWEIFRQVNVKRRNDNAGEENVGIAEQLGGFFDQSQLDPGASEAQLSQGYAR
jgi:hypothetical protein